MPLPSLPPLDRDAFDVLMVERRAAADDRLELARADLRAVSNLETPDVDAVDEARAEFEAARAAVIASPTATPGFVPSILSSISDGSISGRIPAGWVSESDGICWTPWCCGKTHSFPLDCPECGSDEEWEPPQNPNDPAACLTAKAKPFIIEADEYENACSREDRAQVARENVERDTPFHVALNLHAAIRADAEDISDGECVPMCVAFGLLRERVAAPGVLHLPDVGADCAASEGLVSRSGGRTVDIYGSRVLIGPGYPNLMPDGSPPPDGCLAIYMTGAAIDYALGPITVDDGDNRHRGNNKCPHAERRGIVRVDPCDIFMVLAKPCGCCS